AEAAAPGRNDADGQVVPLEALLLLHRLDLLDRAGGELQGEGGRRRSGGRRGGGGGIHAPCISMPGRGFHVSPGESGTLRAAADPPPIPGATAPGAQLGTAPAC